jgi:REP element-mobilizing transposase RayT
MQHNHLNKYRNDTLRLKYWDYSSEGAYFITICTKDREHFFGEIIHGKMILNQLGFVVQHEWEKSIEMRPDMNLTLGEFIVMPDHFHAVIMIGKNQYNTSNEKTESKNKFGPQSKNLASIIRGFKSAITTYSKINGYPNFAWQPRFYEHIIRNQQSFDRIQKYIIDNPKNWKIPL